MGLFDTIEVPCPACGRTVLCQSKGGACRLVRTYTVQNAPDDVWSDVNRHAPHTCECGHSFRVDMHRHAHVVNFLVAPPNNELTAEEYRVDEQLARIAAEAVMSNNANPYAGLTIGDLRRMAVVVLRYTKATNA